MSSCSSLPYSSLLANQRRVPGAVDAEAQTDRIDFLTHRALLRPWRFDFADDDRQVRERLLDAAGAAAGAGVEALHAPAPCRRRPAATTRASTSRSWLFSALAIALSRHFCTSRAIRLLRELEVGERASPPSCRGSAAATQVQLLRRDAQHARDRLRLVVRQARGGLAALPMAHFLFAFLSAAWP